MTNTLFKGLFVMLVVVSICRAAQIEDNFDQTNPLADYSMRPTRQINRGDRTGPISISSANANANSLAINGSIATSNSQALSLPQNLNINGQAVATATATATATAIAKDGSISTATATATAIAVSPILAGRFISGDLLFDIDDYSIYFPGCKDNRALMNYNQSNKQFKCGQFDEDFQGCDNKYKELRGHFARTKKITFEDLTFRCRDQNNNQITNFRRYNHEKDGREQIRNRIRKQRRYIDRRDFNPERFHHRRG